MKRYQTHRNRETGKPSISIHSKTLRFSNLLRKPHPTRKIIPGKIMIRRLAAGGGLLRRSLVAPPLAGGFHTTIQAVPREQTGCRVSSKERAEGRIPSVVITPGEGGRPSQKQLITIERKQVRLILRKFPFLYSTTFKLQVRAGPGSTVVLNSGTVLPKQVHKNEETGEILNLVLAWVEEGSEMKVAVPLVFKGEDECPGLKKGGYLQKERIDLEYICPAEHIPQKIEVDLSKLDIGDTVRMKDIEVHPSVKPLKKNGGMPICKILATKPVEPEPKLKLEADETPTAMEA